MAELYQRLLDIHPTKDKISTDLVQALMGEFRRGALTVDQASQVIDDHYGQPLGTAGTGNESGRADVANLLATIPTGTQTAQRLDRLERILLIEQVLVVADLKPSPYDTVEALTTRLGVPVL